MVKSLPKIIIDDNAKLALRQAYHYILKDSPQNAKKVKEKILFLIRKIPSNPQFYPPDKFRINNDGSFRAFEIYRYRITYHISKDNIRVIRIRHTKLNPINY